MLAEFALTPSIFDKSAHKDREAWLQQLRDLGHGMFPRGAACPVMVSNLYDGTWQAAALKAVSSIDVQDQEARGLCMGFLEKVLEGTLVYRPACSDKEPSNDTAWAKEAVNSISFEPIDRIVTCKPAYEVVLQKCSSVHCIDKVQDDHFWNGISPQWSQPLNVFDQVEALRKLCVHSEFLCLVTPYIRGQDNDETTFAQEMIRSAFRRPKELSPPFVEIHTTVDWKTSSVPDQFKSVVHHVSCRLRSVLVADQQVRLVIWPKSKLLDRYLIAGMYTEMSDGKRVRKSCWGVSMPHIARKAHNDEPMPPTPWSLLTSPQINDVSQHFCKEGLTGYLHDSTVLNTPRLV